MDVWRIKVDTYLNEMREIYNDMTAVRLENKFWRIIVLPESNAKVGEMTYKPKDRNVVQPIRALGSFRFEEWVRQGDDSDANNIMSYNVIKQNPKKMDLEVTTKDGAKIFRIISLVVGTMAYFNQTNSSRLCLGVPYTLP